jgi:hypothetical protein
MSEISRFFGIVIRRYTETGGRHHEPHFHACYQAAVGIYSIRTMQLIAGSLPKRERRFVVTCAKQHEQELREDRRLLQGGRPPRKIEPLR